MEPEIAKTENKMLTFVEDIRVRTYGMCNVGPGPYGLGVCNTNPSQIAIALIIDPDPYSDSFPLIDENTTHTVTLQAYLKGEDNYKEISMEQVKQFCQDRDPATRKVAKAILALSAAPVQVSTKECDEAFSILYKQEIAGLGTRLTQTEARQIYKLKWYRGKTPEEIVSFQISQRHICMPFRKYRRAMEIVLRHPVEMWEFKDKKLLAEEYWIKCIIPGLKNTERQKTDQRDLER